MTRMIDLGRASEETKGTQFHFQQLDDLGVKRLESGIAYRTAPTGNGVKVADED